MNNNAPHSNCHLMDDSSNKRVAHTWSSGRRCRCRCRCFGSFHSLTQKPQSRFRPCRGGLILDRFEGVFCISGCMKRCSILSISLSVSLALSPWQFRFSHPIVHSPKTCSRGKCANFFTWIYHAYTLRACL